MLAFFFNPKLEVGFSFFAQMEATNKIRGELMAVCDGGLERRECGRDIMVTKGLWENEPCELVLEAWRATPSADVYRQKGRKKKSKLESAYVFKRWQRNSYLADRSWINTA